MRGSVRESSAHGCPLGTKGASRAVPACRPAQRPCGCPRQGTLSASPATEKHQRWQRAARLTAHAYASCTRGTATSTEIAANRRGVQVTTPRPVSRVRLLHPTLTSDPRPGLVKEGVSSAPPVARGHETKPGELGKSRGETYPEAKHYSTDIAGSGVAACPSMAPPRLSHTKKRPTLTTRRAGPRPRNLDPTSLSPIHSPSHNLPPQEQKPLLSAPFPTIYCSLYRGM